VGTPNKIWCIFSSSFRMDPAIHIFDCRRFFIANRFPRPSFGRMLTTARTMIAFLTRSSSLRNMSSAGRELRLPFR
jgi:hypothetical protein